MILTTNVLGARYELGFVSFMYITITNDNWYRWFGEGDINQYCLEDKVTD